MDANGYPEEEELETIRKWDSIKDPRGLFNYIIERWKYAEAGYAENKSTADAIVVELHTAGWSGNEDVIGALMDNTMAWLTYWKSSRRGGHYEFDHAIPK